MPPQTFRKKPHEIKALRFDGTNADEVTAWIDENGGAGHKALDVDGDHVIVYTRGGVRRASTGDYVLLTVDGFEVLAEEDFYAAYDSVAASRGTALMKGLLEGHEGCVPDGLDRTSAAAVSGFLMTHQCEVQS